MNDEIANKSGPAGGNGAAIWVFTASRTDPKILEAILVQRHALLQDSVERVRESATTGHKHHLLFVGPRGCGKTHLVTLIVSRVAADAELADRLRIAWLNEDETCTSLLELLIKIHAALEKRYPQEYPEETLEEVFGRKPKEALEFLSKRLLDALGSRTLLVVAENLDAVFEGLGGAGQMELRAFVQENPRLCLVATAQRLVEDLSDRNGPFFGFFQTEHLKVLNEEEARELLLNIARIQQKDSLVEFLSSNRGRSRIRALHHLSGGNHRIYIVLSQFITRETIDALLAPFLKMVDELTPYYQERVRWLPTLQRKIVEFLCTCEGTVPVKTIARRLFATPQSISGQLQDLRQKGYVEANQRGRESLYEISEPLMRICVEVKENQLYEPLRLIVDFLRVWYDEPELKDRLGIAAMASESRAYLERAIERNAIEGSLRKKIFLKNVEQLLPQEMGLAERDAVLHELADEPEAVTVCVLNLYEGNLDRAIQCLNEAIGEECNPSDKAALLIRRAGIFAARNELANAAEDFTEVIDLAGAGVKQVAKALVERAEVQDKIGNKESAIRDYTKATELPHGPIDQVARAFVDRGIVFGELGNEAREIGDYSAVIELVGAPVEQVARARWYRGITYEAAGERQKAIDDYSAAIELSGAPAQYVAMALDNRADLLRRAGEARLAVEDWSAIIKLHHPPVDILANALLNRGGAYIGFGETKRAAADFTALINFEGASEELVAKAFLLRGHVHQEAAQWPLAHEDFTAILALNSAPSELKINALISRGYINSNLGQWHKMIEDFSTAIETPAVSVLQRAWAYFGRAMGHLRLNENSSGIQDCTAVIELAEAPPECVTYALNIRGLQSLIDNSTAAAKADFETVVRLPSAPAAQVMTAYKSLAEIHFSEGQWTSGFEALEWGFKYSANAELPDQPESSNSISQIFSVGLNAESRKEKLRTLIRIYNTHNALAVLGEGITKHLGSVFRIGEPFPSTDNLEDWYTAWAEAARETPDLSLTLRLLRTGVNFLKTGGKDRGVLLDLASTERSILEQAFGLAEEGAAQSTPSRES